MRIRETKPDLRLQRTWAAASASTEQDWMIAGSSCRQSSAGMQPDFAKPDRSPRHGQPVPKPETLPKLKNSDHDRETVLRLIRRIKEQQA